MSNLKEAREVYNLYQDEIINLINDGYSYAMLAERYGVTALAMGTVCRENRTPSICRKIQQLKDNVAKKPEIREKISNTVRQLWDDGVYNDRINGMLNKFGELHHNWSGGKHLYKEKYAYYNPNEKLICEHCGKTISESKIDIHHIDEDHNNNLITNLEALCVNCHQQYHLWHSKTPYQELRKEFEFDAGHFLPYYQGKCFFQHGHRYKLGIVLKRRVDKLGFVYDFAKLSKIVKERIISIIDHEQLNNYIVNPTSENILMWIWRQLSPYIKGIIRLELWESATGRVSLESSEVLKLVNDGVFENEWLEDWINKDGVGLTSLLVKEKNN